MDLLCCDTIRYKTLNIYCVITKVQSGIHYYVTHSVPTQKMAQDFRDEGENVLVREEIIWQEDFVHAGCNLLCAVKCRYNKPRTTSTLTCSSKAILYGTLNKNM